MRLILGLQGKGLKKDANINIIMIKGEMCKEKESIVKGNCFLRSIIDEVKLHFLALVMVVLMLRSKFTRQRRVL